MQMLNHKGPQGPWMLSFLVCDSDFPSEANCPPVPPISAQKEDPTEYAGKCLHEPSPLITTQALIMWLHSSTFDHTLKKSLIELIFLNPDIWSTHS